MSTRISQGPTRAGLGWAASASLWSESDFTGLEFNRIFVVFFFFFFCKKATTITVLTVFNLTPDRGMKG